MGWVALVVIGVIVALIVITILSGIRIVRPTTRGRASSASASTTRYAHPGFHW